MADQALQPLPTITEWFGNGDYDFFLPLGMLSAIQTTCKRSIGHIYQGAMLLEGNVDEHIEVIRHGLIGGGMPPKEAGHLIDTYALYEGGDRLQAIAVNVLANFMRSHPTDGGGESVEKKSEQTTDGLT